MVERFGSGGVPPEVRQASRLIGIYAAIVLISVFWSGISNDFENTRWLVRGIVRFAGMAFIAYKLPALDKRILWFAIIACSYFTVMGVVGIAGMTFLGVAYDAAYIWTAVSFVFPIILLGRAALILISTPTRRHFS